MFNVKPKLVCFLIKNERVGKITVAKLIEKEKAKVARHSQIYDCVAYHLEKQYHIWKAE